MLVRSRGLGDVYKRQGGGGRGLRVVGRERALGAAADATKKSNKRRSRLREKG